MTAVRQKIAIDIDDVVSSQTDMIFQFSKEKLGLDLTWDDMMTPGEYWGYYESVWKRKGQSGAELFSQFLEEKYPLRQVIDPQTVAALRYLKHNYQLEIITSRGVDYQEGTIKWLEEHVPGLFDQVHFVDMWHQADERATKAKICQEIGAGYLIDDSPEHCNLAAESGVQALLFGRFGWNIGAKLHPGVDRVTNWQEVVDYFDGQN